MRQRKGQQKGERLADRLARILPRIGMEPQDRLAWLVGVIQRPAQMMTPGDHENLRLELAALIRADGPPQGHLAAMRAPDPEEIGPILRRLGAMVEAAVGRKEIPLWKVQREQSLLWNPDRGRFEDPPPPIGGWLWMAVATLANLLRAHGHLVRACPAPAVRAEEPCGVWFLANRPDQEYCGSKCRSRHGTRASRAKNGGA